MGTVFTNWGSLNAILQKEMNAAIDEATQKSYEDLRTNVNHFYDSEPSPRYQRTGQLNDSPQLDDINHGGSTASAQISINTGTQYDPAGRDTETIYEYAESGGLRGNGGFWIKTESEIQSNIDDAFGKRFN